MEERGNGREGSRQVCNWDRKWNFFLLFSIFSFEKKMFPKRAKREVKEREERKKRKKKGRFFFEESKWKWKRIETNGDLFFPKTFSLQELSFEKEVLSSGWKF